MPRSGSSSREALPNASQPRPAQIAALPPIEQGPPLSGSEHHAPGAGRTSVRCTRADCATPRSGSRRPPRVADEPADGRRGGRSEQEASWPVAVTPASTAAEKTAAETRPSWPTTIGPGSHPPAYAAANSTAVAGSSPSPTTPRSPEMLAILVPPPPIIPPESLRPRLCAIMPALNPAGQAAPSLRPTIEKPDSRRQGRVFHRSRDPAVVDMPPQLLPVGIASSHPRHSTHVPLSAMPIHREQDELRNTIVRSCQNGVFTHNG